MTRTVGWLEWLLAAVVIGTSAPGAASESVCAEVRIEILQQVSMERQAFEATLKINNGLDGIDISGLHVSVNIVDEDGRAVPISSDPGETSASFFIRLDHTEGIKNANVSGGGVVAGRSSGEARWLIIPARGAAGSTADGRIYRVGATIRYSVGNDPEQMKEVVPETITVKPQPELSLDYFLPNQVFSQNPFTLDPENPPGPFELAEPFTLGLRLNNTGIGEARRVQIDSGQPTITRNDQGLLVDFRIIGSSVDNEPGSPSLNVELGDVASHGHRVARWTMVTSLHGWFVDFNASFTHAPELGGAMTSFISEGGVRAHTLVREVLADHASSPDDIVDFLALREGGDELYLYESNGIDTPVADVSDSASVQVLGNGQFAFDIGSSQGMVYASVRLHDTPADPRAFVMNPVAALRPDGSPLPSRNAWISRTWDPDRAQPYHYFVNLFDAKASGGTYALALDEALAPARLSGEVYLDLDADGERGPEDPGLAAVSLALTGVQSNGEALPERAAVTDGAGAFEFTNLLPGTYTLIVGDAPGTLNHLHFPGSAGGVAGIDRITDIAVGSGIHAIDYRLSKRPRGPADGADIAADFQVQVMPVRTSDPLEMSLDVRNLGPRDAGEVLVTVDVPEHATVDATASVGVFDAYTGQWLIPELAAGNVAQLQFTGGVGRTGQHRFGALALETGGNAYDPDEANNAAHVDILIDPWDLQARHVGWQRLLSIDDCVAGEAGEPGVCDTALQLATAANLVDWSASLGAADVRLLADAGAFGEFLKDGDANLAWLRGSGEQIQATMVADLRALVHRGGRVIISAPFDSLDPGIAAWLDGLGAEPSAEGVFTVAAPEDGPFPPGFHEGEGRNARLLPPDGASVLASYLGGGVAAVELEQGQGRIWVLGFDPLAASSAAIVEAFAPAVEAFSQPGAGELVDVDGIIAFEVEVSAGEFPTVAELDVVWDRAMDVLSIDPADGERDQGSVRWSFDPEPGAGARFRVEFLAPDVPEESVVAVSASRNRDGEPVSIGSISLPVTVLDFSELIERADALLPGLHLPPVELEPIEASLGAAQQHFALGRYGLARRTLGEGVDGLIASGVSAGSLEAILEATGFAYRVVRRLDRSDGVECPVDRGVAGPLDSELFVPVHPQVGFRLAGVMAPALPWSASVESAESEDNRLLMPADQQAIDFDFVRNGTGQSSLAFRRGGTTLATFEFQDVEGFDAIVIRMNLDPGPGVPFPPRGRGGMTRLSAFLDEISGQAVDIAHTIVLTGQNSAEFHLVVPKLEEGSSYSGRMVPMFGSWLQVMAEARIEVQHGRVNCGEAP